MSILSMTVSGTMMILIIIGIRRLFLHKLPKNLFIALWLLVLLRLLIPAVIPSVLSVQNLINKDATIVFTNDLDGTMLDRDYEESVGAIEEVKSDTVTKSEQFPYFAIIWGCGIFAAGIVFVSIYIRTYRKLRCSLPLPVNPFLDEWLQRHQIMRGIEIRQSDMISSPITMGIIKPKIILPKTPNLKDEELLIHILEHEFCHIRRFDAVWKLCMAAAICIHWFNPFVWLMFLMLNRDLEITCDEMVLRRLGEDSVTSYAYALIAMAERRSKGMQMTFGFGNHAEERIKSIMSKKKITKAGIIVSCLIITGIAAVFATDGLTEAADTVNHKILESGNAYDEESDKNSQDSASGYGKASEDNKIPALDYDSVGADSKNQQSVSGNDTAGGDIGNSEWAAEEEGDFGASSIFGELLEEYKEFGVTANGQRLYYKGEPVRFFVDNRSGNPKTFLGSVHDMEDGVYYLETKRDADKKLIAIEEITKERADDLRFWRDN